MREEIWREIERMSAYTRSTTVEGATADVLNDAHMPREQKQAFLELAVAYLGPDRFRETVVANMRARSALVADAAEVRALVALRAALRA